MAIKLYQLFCSHCLYKKLTDGSDLANLTEVKTCKECGGSRQFKCPKCGYLMRVTKAQVSTSDEAMKEMEKLREQEKDKKERQEAAAKRLLRQKQHEERDDNTLL